MNYINHIYIGSQRIIGQLGEDGTYQYLLDPKNTIYVAGGDTINWDKKMLRQKDAIIADFEDLGLDGVVFTAGKSGKTPYGQIKKYFREMNGDGATQVKDTTKATANAIEKFRYFYHPDHLGSSSYITDASGEVYQHFEYFPYGETFVEDRGDHHRTPYLFNGKELDKETGLYYYGARYYDPRISMWYGVDPMADKYSSLSPFAYCANNPVLFIDPNGMKIEGTNKTSGQKVLEDLHAMFANKKFDDFRKLIKLDKNGKTISQIDPGAITSYLANTDDLSKDDQALIAQVTDAINAKDVYKVEYIDIKDNASTGFTSAFKKHLNSTQAGLGDIMVPGTQIPGSLINGIAGSGLTTPTKNGSWSVILEGTGIVHDGGREITTGHEVIGHGVAVAHGLGDKDNNTRAIRTDNLIRRVLGNTHLRDGSHHAGGKVTNPNDLPGIF